MIKLFVKRYILIIPLVLLVYSACLLLLLISNDFNTMLKESFCSIVIVLLLNSLLIRLLDDYNDYERDIKINKSLFSKKILLILSSIIIFLSIILSFTYKPWFNTISLLFIIFIGNNFFQKRFNFEFMKTLILPLLIMYTFFSIDLKINIWCYLFMFLSFIIAIVYLIKKIKGVKSYDVL